MLDVILRLGCLAVAVFCVWAGVKWVSELQAGSLPHDFVKGEDWGVGPEMACLGPALFLLAILALIAAIAAPWK